MTGLQGRRRLVGQGAQARPPSRRLLASGQRGVAAADEHDLLGAGLPGRRNLLDPVVRTRRGERGDRGGDLRGGGRGLRVVGALAVQPLAGRHVDDHGRAPPAERGVAQESVEGAREGPLGGRGRRSGGAAETRQHGGGAGRGLRRRGGRIGTTSVICATLPFSRCGPVTLGRTLTGGVPGPAKAAAGRECQARGGGDGCEPRGRELHGTRPYGLSSPHHSGRTSITRPASHAAARSA